MATIRRKSKLANGSAAGKPNLTMAYGAVASDLMQRLGDAQAAQMGPPTSSEDKVAPATAADRVKAWNTRNPEATDEAMLAMAVQKYQEHLASGMDPATAERATAEDLTHFRYDQRLPIYTYGTVGFSEQVELAERMAKLAARKSTPNPLPPAPTMPSAAMTNAATSGEWRPSDEGRVASDEQNPLATRHSPLSTPSPLAAALPTAMPPGSPTGGMAAPTPTPTPPLTPELPSGGLL